MILIEIDYPPVSWSAHQGYGKRAYNPKQREREHYQWQIKAHYNQLNPLPGPIKVDYTFHMAIPKGTSKVRRLQMLNGMMHHIVRPDVDNLNKFLSDCLKGIVFEDDSQVVELNSRKIYGEKAKTLIKVESVCRLR